MRGQSKPITAVTDSRVTPIASDATMDSPSVACSRVDSTSTLSNSLETHEKRLVTGTTSRDDTPCSTTFIDQGATPSVAFGLVSASTSASSSPGSNPHPTTKLVVVVGVDANCSSSSAAVSISHDVSLDPKEGLRGEKTMSERIILDAYHYYCIDCTKREVIFYQSNIA